MKKDDILYEDNSIIVVKKKANVLSQDDNTKDKSLLTEVKDYIKKKYNKPGNVYIGLVHRLDRPVSGIMVFARNSKSAARLSKQITEKKFKKKYIAVVNGLLEKDEETFIDYLKRNGKKTEISKEKDGKYSELSYKVLKRNKKKRKTLVEIDLKTGRHHQIRAQFATRGYPLCGDQLYGKEDKTGIALCAYNLEFTHPIKKEVMTFKIPMPKGVHWDDFYLQ